MTPWRFRLKENVAEVRERIARASRRASRTADAIRLVAVTKQVGEDVAHELVELGVTDLGESRPQELWRKHDSVSGPVHWHLVGPLQKNKARRTLPMVEWIHSVDTLPLLSRLDELAIELHLSPSVLLEVNVSGESTKHGFEPAELPYVISTTSRLSRLQVLGLMTMAPYDEDPERARPYFVALRELRDRLAIETCRLAELSIGMSGDFEVAVEEGATMVRIGSALFRGLQELT